jgi:riboflavin kinase/FMN adenylyltransferase
MTFDPHPLQVLAPNRALPLLTPLDEKLRLLEKEGVDATVVIQTTGEFLKTDAAKFVEEVVVGAFHPAHVVEGATFSFGAGRKGTVETLESLGPEYGFSATIVPSVRLDFKQVERDDVHVRSSLIRSQLSAGRVGDAARCLTREYRLFGNVVEGSGRGRNMGFPTLNLKVENGQLIPAEGVYAGWALVGLDRYPAGISIGRNPTFAERELKVEAHLPDARIDGYGRDAALDFLEWIRPQRRFEDADDLARQIAKDIDQVREAASTHAA